jgi:hypothetical protein
LVWEPFNIGVNSDAVTWVGLWGDGVSVSDQLFLRPLHADSDSWNSPQVICLLVFGSLMSVFFVYSEKCLAKYPLMVLDIFKERSNIACVAVGFFHGFVSLKLAMSSNLTNT